MIPMETALLVTYFVVLLLLSAFGFHRVLMLYLYYRHKYNRPRLSGRLEELPAVTIQLPLYNEIYVTERLIDAVCRIRYPRDRFEIQVLDDSTDETGEVARACVERWRARGIDIQYVHRDDRRGFKAGALENGLKKARGEMIAVFDADFVPEPDFLEQTIPYFGDPRVGMVQARWGHINRDYSTLTHVQSILLDGHFVIEHAARNRSGRFFNFNGTAGIWRRSAIIDAGGWQHDTLTEDLDLSYRAQLKGWRFIFLPDVLSPAELPVEMNAFKGQQFRWAKGSIQTAKKLVPLILRSPIDWRVKLEAFFHLSNNLAYLLMVILAALLPLSLVIRQRHGWYEVIFLDLPFFLAATASVCAFYVFSQWEADNRPLGWRVLYLPFIMSVGIGLSINNAKAVLEALLGHETEFTRTPKYHVEHRGENWRAKRYRGRRTFVPIVELAFAVYYTASIAYSFHLGIYSSIPFLVLFQIGFIYTSFMSLFQGDSIFRRPARQGASSSSSSAR